MGEKILERRKIKRKLKMGGGEVRTGKNNKAIEEKWPRATGRVRNFTVVDPSFFFRSGFCIEFGSGCCINLGSGIQADPLNFV